MLKEFLGVRQEEPGVGRSGFRRLFTDEKSHLYLWYEKQGGAFLGFQDVLIDRGGEPTHAFTWEADKSSGFSGVTTEGRSNPSPMLVVNGKMPKTLLLDLFRETSEEVDASLRELILTTIGLYSD